MIFFEKRKVLKITLNGKKQIFEPPSQTPALKISASVKEV
jgi:hypothetical protein